MRKIVFLAFIVLILIGCCEKCLAAVSYDDYNDDEEYSSDNDYGGAGIGFGLGIFIGFAAGMHYGKGKE
jgi:MFS superfamily sulfate permease-like transporter